jgi:hypothetical protein
MTKKDVKYRTNGFIIADNAYDEVEDEDNPGTTIKVMRSPDLIYAMIQKECPENLIIALEDLFRDHVNEELTKEFIAKTLWGGPPIGHHKVIKQGRTVKIPYWLNSTRERNIRNSIAEMVTFLSRPIVATSHNTGYVYTLDEEVYTAGLLDLRQRWYTLGLRIAGLERAHDVVKGKRLPDPISDNRFLKQASLGI